MFHNYLYNYTKYIIWVINILVAKLLFIKKINKELVIDDIGKEIEHYLILFILDVINIKKWLKVKETIYLRRFDMQFLTKKN